MTAETFSYLVRHAESGPHDIPELRPLTETGQRQATELIAPLGMLRLTWLFSSPYIRAIDTMRPYALQSGLELHVLPDLRERELHLPDYAEYELEVSKGWEDFHYAPIGFESGYACQLRLSICLESIARAYPGERLAACSHGQAIAFYLTLLDPGFGMKGWKAMRNPDLFKVTFNAQAEPTAWEHVVI